MKGRLKEEIPKGSDLFHFSRLGGAQLSKEENEGSLVGRTASLFSPNVDEK